MHCGFLSYSLFYLTHIVALDAFIVLLSYLMLVIYISAPVAHFVEEENIYIDLKYDQCILYFLRIDEFVSKSSWLT